MIIEEITKIIVSDIMVGINLILIAWVVLHWIEKKVLPQIPRWIHDYRMVTIEKAAIDRATGGRRWRNALIAIGNYIKSESAEN